MMRMPRLSFPTFMTYILWVAKRGSRYECAINEKVEIRPMSIRVDSAARYFCELSNWSLSNLALQKLLYLAQVEHADSYDGARLIEADFQAWDYGPVVPSLYRKLKLFGADCVENVFYEAREIRPRSNSDKTIRRVWREFGSAEPGELIEVSHWERGAWAKNYEPGVKGIAIPHDDVIREARNRRRYRDEWEEIIST